MKLYKVVALLFFQSCGVFTNTTRKTTKETLKARSSTAAIQVAARSTTMTSDGLVFRTDSADMMYSMQFWPKGIFSFSAGKGFTGEADQVIIHAYVKEGSELKEINHVEENASGEWKNIIDQRQERQSDEKTSIVENVVSWKWVLILSVLSLIGIAYLKINR